VPAYDREQVRVGIVHLGPGAFHRAHEAAYVDACLAATGDLSWGICTVGVLPADAAVRDALGAQDGLYTLLTVSPDGAEEARVIGSIVRHLHAPDDPEAVLDVLADPATRIVSLTITEAGYGPEAPAEVFELVVAALARRRAAGTPPFTVLSCDNLQGNGDAARAAVTRAAARVDPELAEWIDEHVAFPSSMVDRITPATTDETRAAVRARGIDDAWPVRAESFAQWVVEDRFGLGRPALERVGVQVVPDVAPYEKLKLRLLNASHQALAYVGILEGAEYVHEVCRDPLFARFLRGYLHEARPTLDPVPGVDVDDYCDRLLERFAGDAIQDTLARQAIDGPDKIRTYLVPVVADRLRAGDSVSHGATVLAAWCAVLAEHPTVEPTGERWADLRAAARREAVAPGSFLRHPFFGDLGSDPVLGDAFRVASESLRRLGPRGALAALADDH
jgi:mannitol 2-dehydrogenase